MKNFLRKTIGFAIGSGACSLILFYFFSSTGLAPRGAGWIFIVLASGALGARLASKPTETLAEFDDIKRPISSKWWGLSPGLRLSIFLSILWMIGAHVWIDSYDRTFNNTYAPAIGFIFAYLGYSVFVKEPIGSIEKGEHSPQLVFSENPAVNLPEQTTPVEPQTTETSRSRQRSMDELISRMKKS